MIALTKQDTTQLLPTPNIYMCEGKSTTSSKTEADIYGNQVVVHAETKAGTQSWTLGAAYVQLATVQGTLDAYRDHNTLTLTDDAGATHSVTITEYPAIDRHKLPDGTLGYTVRVTLGKAASAWSIPVINLHAPRLFGR